MRAAAALGRVHRKLSAVRTTLSLMWRLRTRALSAGARVGLRVRGYSSRVRGLRVRIGRGARVRLTLGDDVTIEPGVRLDLGTGILVVGDRAAMAPGVTLEVGEGGTLLIGHRARLGKGAVVRAVGRTVEIGPDAEVEDYVVVSGGDAARDMEVGRGARLGPWSVLLGGALVAEGSTLPPRMVVDAPAGQGPPLPASTGDRPEVSVVVTTRDRAAFLPALFGALREQTLPPERFEVVAVDDGSTDRTADLLEELSRTAPFEVKVIRRPSSGGPAAGRNEGWRAARAPVVAFTDDDCRPAPGWLAVGLTAVRDGPDLVQGRTLPEPLGEAEPSTFVLTNRVTEEIGHYETCNMFYRRSVLEELGGFDERYSYPMAEDTDLALRALEAGRRSGFEPGALLYHVVHPAGMRGLLGRGRRLASHALMVRKHPGFRRMYEFRYFIRRSHPYLLLAAAGTAAAFLVSPWWALGAVPYALHHLIDSELPLSVTRRLGALPAFLVIDGVEMASLAVASVRYRRLLL